jgi:hypothetical protein
MGARRPQCTEEDRLRARQYTVPRCVSAISEGLLEARSSVVPMSDSRERHEGAEQPQSDLYTTVVRIVAGGIGEGIDRLMRVSAELDDADVAPPGQLVGPIDADPTVMAFIGWTSELPRTIRSLGASTYRLAYPVVRLAAVAIDTTAVLAEATGVAPFIAGVTEPMRTAIHEERERLSDVGAAEYARGRVLATHAFEQSVDGIVSLLSDSEELGELVREQTLGVTGSAVQEIRETSAAADHLTEGLFRKLVRRPDRVLPPTPAGET